VRERSNASRFPTIDSAESKNQKRRDPLEVSVPRAEEVRMVFVPGGTARK
jgi:hypothetical protein